MKLPPLTTLYQGLKVDPMNRQIGFSLASDVIGSRLTVGPLNMSKILLPGDYSKPITRKELIDKFLKDWLTKKQQESMGIWVRDLLQAFSTDLLLHAKEQGIDRMLIDQGVMTSEGAKTIFRSREKSYPLAVITKPKKPVKVPVTLEDLGSDLEADTNLLPTNQPTTQNVNEQ